MKYIAKTFLLPVLLLLSGLTEMAACKEPPLVFVSHFENVLGTSLELKVAAESESLAAFAEERALAEIDRLEAILSAYSPESEFSRWKESKGDAKRVSKELFEILHLFDQWRERSSGALDASAEVISQLWKQAAARQQLPTAQERALAISRVKQTHWILDEASQTATHLSDAPLMLNTFVKSYIIRRAAEAAMAVQGIRAVVVNIGGDIVIMGDHAETVRISDPKADSENDNPVAILHLQNKAIATSGNYRRGFSIKGQWFSHIVDPRSALPAGNIISATVITPNATDAGALATAFNLLRPEESIELASRIPGTEFLIIAKDGKRFSSKGWPSVPTQVKASEPLTQNTLVSSGKSTQPSWKTEYELQVNLELARFEGRFRRPFVAVWIENSKRETVRTLALWYDRPRWLPDLKSWYRKNFTSYTNGSGTDIASISSATRPPGKYALKWDGKDDKGKLVDAGVYTIHIEAAREHGTYQLISQEIDCGSKPKQINLNGNIEVTSASLEYRKKAKKKNE